MLPLDLGLGLTSDYWLEIYFRLILGLEYTDSNAPQKLLLGLKCSRITYSADNLPLYIATIYWGAKYDS